MIMMYREGVKYVTDGLSYDCIAIPFDGVDLAKEQGWKTHAEFFLAEPEAKRRGRPPKVKEDENANETKPSESGVL